MSKWQHETFQVLAVTPFTLKADEMRGVRGGGQAGRLDEESGAGWSSSVDQADSHKQRQDK